jgi:hypothetical protein
VRKVELDTDDIETINIALRRHARELRVSAAVAKKRGRSIKYWIDSLAQTRQTMAKIEQLRIFHHTELEIAE